MALVARFLPLLVAAFLLSASPWAVAQTPVPSAAASVYTKLATVPQVRTKLLGREDGTPVEDTLPSGGLLVGFDVWYGDYSGHLGVVGLQAIYATSSGRVRGELKGAKNGAAATVEAREGYAVSQVAVRTGDNLDGFEITFWRIGPAGLSLDAAGAYTSPWMGGKGGTKARSPLSGHGNPIIGFFGTFNGFFRGLGLIVGKTR